ncbi:MAG TPA: ATP synthase F1 subunit delta, partial [Gemmatimonadaceae bacterium]|nr:ATP synthase F1 subunit delta [Gemmatimonadaceae bacterium]
MRDTTIARNYAEALLALARKAGDLQAWGRLIDDVAAAMERDERLRRFLEAPQISADEKNAVLAKAYEDRAPRLFLRYLQRLVMNRRQMLIPEIANEYRDLVDEVEGRVHAQVTVAKEVDDEERAAISRQLSQKIGKPVVPQVRVNPNIVGGIIV